MTATQTLTVKIEQQIARVKAARDVLERERAALQELTADANRLTARQPGGDQ
jgi:hypothetical protein